MSTLNHQPKKVGDDEAVHFVPNVVKRVRGVVSICTVKKMNVILVKFNSYYNKKVVILVKFYEFMEKNFVIQTK